MGLINLRFTYFLMIDYFAILKKQKTFQNLNSYFYIESIYFNIYKPFLKR